ncbi:MFS transporter [Acidocella sp.]|uniref:MFS transporter n=1 Tax=Acidocella sp. TaxID=50710 RepID=UPI002609D866|nr:MFS transporter [Acidocella sp.]
MAETGLGGRRFLPLFLTQALGAVNDNLFKNALVVMALARLPARQAAVLSALSAGLFLLPYLLVSAPAGQLADAHDKARLSLWTKFWELGLMLLGLAGFLSGDFRLLLAVLTGLGLQAAFFSPLKYGMLPELFSGRALARANGLIEAGTFAGIVLGTAAGGALITLRHGVVWAPLAAAALSLAGIASAWAMPPLRPAAPGLKPDWRLWRANLQLLRAAAANPPVWHACWGISWFWALGATVLAAFPVLAKTRLHADGQVVTWLLTLFAAGVGLGAMAAARLARPHRLGLVLTLSGAGMSLFIADFAWAGTHLRAPGLAALLSQSGGWRASADLVLTAFCGGAFSVPLYVRLQARAAPRQRARMVAANNVLNAAATLAAGGAEALAYARGAPSAALLYLAAALNLGVTAWLARAARRD